MGTFLTSFQGDTIKEFQQSELWYSELWHPFPTILGSHRKRETKLPCLIAESLLNAPRH